MRPRAGVTLMEMLIAVTLLSLLSVGILMAMRVGFTAMEKTNSRLMANRRSVGAQRVLEQQIAGFMPVQADCLAAPGQPPARIPFFQGEPQSMRFVSTYSLEEAARGLPRILEFQVLPGANREGVRLVVNEHLYAGPLSTGQFCRGGPPVFAPIQAGPRSFVLADRLAGCRFLFRRSLPAPLYETWEPRWVRPEWPTAIRVELIPLEADAAKVPLLSITAPLKAQKDPAFQYVN
ncbi:MAG: prepilin-type N-terminal cleavage/methylation domain-containing protein [Acidobacteria bacterium]|nr:prepilin-type N-terminal cleavage/methylation domain-containing protein [Acidobacteriota bacterium]